MRLTRLNRHYVDMIIGQCNQVARAHFIDVVDMMCMGRLD